jgi:hypothetical protein
LVLAAAITCGGAFVVQGEDAPVVQPVPSAGDRPVDTGVGVDVSRDGVTVREQDRSDANRVAPDADDIRKTIADVTEDAFEKGGFDNVVRKFVDADRNRLNEFKSDDNYAKLDGRIDAFRKNWKAKYGQDFEYENRRNDVLNDSFARITQGEIGEARTASGTETPSATPQNVQGGNATDLQKSGVATPDAQSDKTAGGDTNKEAGRNVATFTIPAGFKVEMKPGELRADANKDLSIPMIHEFPDAWKIDLPDNVDGQKLHDALLKHITMFDEDRANWPADVNEAYRMATKHIMMAFFEGTSM